MEGGREDSPSGWGARAFFVGHGTRNPESRGGKAGRERIGGKLGEGWGEEAWSSMRIRAQSLEGLTLGK